MIADRPRRSALYMPAANVRAIEKARGMTDQAERCKLYQDLTAQIVGKDAAWVPLFSLDHSYVVQPRVKNFTVPWNGWSDMNYYNVEVE